MVIINIKLSEQNQSYVQFKTQDLIQDIQKVIIQIVNSKTLLQKLLVTIRDLIEYGPARPESLRGLEDDQNYHSAFEMLTDEEKQFMNQIAKNNKNFNKDPQAIRVGYTCPKETQIKIWAQIDDINKQFLTEPKNNKLITIREINEAISTLTGCVMIMYPGYHNLPQWDISYLLLEFPQNIKQYFPDCFYFEETYVALWWAKKELKTDQQLKYYIGNNEKTTIMVKINKKDQGAPVQESPVDPETQKKMMAYYYKKQEEHKKLISNLEDNLIDSEWADPKQLKNQLQNNFQDLKLKY